MSTQNQEMQRGLKNRHIQMIALGGAIGTGLFYGSAQTIQLVGPGITLSYLIGGTVIFLIMRMLGEMSVDEPVSGSFSHYAYKYWGEFSGFLASKANFVIDYLKSDADTNNDALVLGVSYAFDHKNTFSAYSHRTGSNSHIYTDWDPSEKGAYYIYNHTFDKTTALNLLYKDNTKNESDATDNTSFRASISYKF